MTAQAKWICCCRYLCCVTDLGFKIVLWAVNIARGSCNELCLVTLHFLRGSMSPASACWRHHARCWSLFFLLSYKCFLSVITRLGSSFRVSARKEKLSWEILAAWMYSETTSFHGNSIFGLASGGPWGLIHTGRAHVNLNANPLMLLACSVNTPVHTHRFHLLCLALRVLCGWGLKQLLVAVQGKRKSIKKKTKKKNKNNKKNKEKTSNRFLRQIRREMCGDEFYEIVVHAQGIYLWVQRKFSFGKKKALLPILSLVFAILWPDWTY